MDGELDQYTTDNINRIAKITGRNFARYLDVDDVRQELWIYATENAHHFDVWAGKGEQHRIGRALRGRARMFGEQTKADVEHYDIDDISWYSPGKVASLLPFAFDSQFADQATGAGQVAFEGGALLVMVLDVRAALHARPDAAFTVQTQPEDSTEFLTALQDLCDALGGEYPQAPEYRGRREVTSNAAALVSTEV